MASMRSYIFTPRERELIKAFLNGRLEAGGRLMDVIRWRVRSFKRLANDVELYIKLRARESEAMPTKPA